MKSNRKTFLDVALYFVAFVLIQIVVSLVAMLAFKGANNAATVNVVVTIVSSVLAIGLFAWRKWSPLNGDYINTRPWFTLFWVVCLSVGSIAPLSYVSELADLKLPSQYEQLFSGIMAHNFGYLAVGVLAPIAEEMVFRGAMLRRLAEFAGYRRRWTVIALTALLFGLSHGNMAQGMNAFLVGLLLGWMYVRTGSIVPGVVFHLTNNTIAFVLYRVMPQTANLTITEYFHGDMKYIAILLVSSLMIFFAALYQLNYRLQPTEGGRA